MRKLTLLLLASTLLLVLCALPGAQPAADPPTVTVGVWNLEWLGTPERRRDADGNLLALRSVPDLERIAAMLTDVADFEVAVLTEINVVSRQWSRLKQMLAVEGFDFVEGSGGDQRVVVAYDTDEIVLRSSFEPGLSTHFARAGRFGSGRCEAGGRLPVFANLVGGEFEFTVVGVHLKSMYQPEGCDDPTFTAYVRGRQVVEIADEIAQRRDSLQPHILVVGDFNSQPGDAGLLKARERSFRILTDGDHRTSASAAISYRKGPYRSLLDHIALLSPAAERWWIKGSTLVLPAFSTRSGAEHDRWRRSYSDHAPAWAEFRRSAEKVPGP